MTNQIRNPNVEGNGRVALCSDFGLRASFGFRHSSLSSGMNENSKHQNESPKRQAPNTRHTPNSKLQGANVAESIGIWSLGFLWILVFGVWCFVLSPLA